MPDERVDLCTACMRSGHVTDRATMSGPGCSKLTTSLVNVSLNFQTLILQIHCYILFEKCENLLHCKRFSHFSTKYNSVFDNLVSIYLTS